MEKYENFNNKTEFQIFQWNDLLTFTNKTQTCLKLYKRKRMLFKLFSVDYSKTTLKFWGILNIYFDFWFSRYLLPNKARGAMLWQFSIRLGFCIALQNVKCIKPVQWNRIINKINYTRDCISKDGSCSLNLDSLINKLMDYLWVKHLLIILFLQFYIHFFKLFLNIYNFWRRQTSLVSVAYKRFIISLWDHLKSHWPVYLSCNS